MACSLKPNDISVLNRYGRSLWNRSLAMKTSNHQKLEYLEQANKILSDSINVDSDGNWFAYTTRMHVRLDIADTVIKHNQKKTKNSLENAKKDGHICFKSKNTRRTMTVLARSLLNFLTSVTMDLNL
jgi:hypothetical protein